MNHSNMVEMSPIVRYQEKNKLKKKEKSHEKGKKKRKRKYWRHCKERN